MKQLTHRTRRHLAAYLLLIALLAACQGRGRVHEAPAASYPEDAPAEPTAVPDGARAAPAPPPAGEDEAGPSDNYSEPPAASGAASPASPGEAQRQAAPEAKAESSASVGRSADRDSSWDDGRGPLAPRKAPEPRPGLATHWGETRYSPARQVDFERSDAERPSAMIELRYNDRSGARRMLPSGSWGRAEAYALGGVRVRIVDSAGHTLPALARGSRVIGVGAPGERYSLEIENPTSARFEVVASVDGLDVLDGEDASFEKRGYLIGAYTSVSIDGFRRSDAEVAAFRLGDVSGSYAASKGKARNVGVIGFALFEERRPVVYAPPVWRRPASPDDTAQRRNADPFPGRYARPPVW
jgi:hypothetical protein